MLTYFAGPIFTEWYWGPIFFALTVAPWIVAAVTAVANLVLLNVILHIYIQSLSDKAPRHGHGSLHLVQIFSGLISSGVVGYLIYRYAIMFVAFSAW